MYIDSQDLGLMIMNGITVTWPHTFTRGGVYTLFVFCYDLAGGMAAGANTSILVAGPIIEQPVLGGVAPSVTESPVVVTPAVTAPVVSVPVVTPPVVTPAPQPIVTPGAPAYRSLMKLECPADAGGDHPCTAVYYYGADGKRHAFPNAKVYFTWFANFDAVVTVSPAIMQAIPLGKNVIYKPGARMVKFQTENRVYAVSRTGALRWVPTEALAIALYGMDWNTKIDDIADAFYTNYAFGADITNATDYQASAESTATADIDAVL